MKKSMTRVLRKAGKTLLNCLIEAICFAAAALVQKTLLKGFKSFGKRRTAQTAPADPTLNDDKQEQILDPTEETTEASDEFIDTDFTEEK